LNLQISLTNFGERMGGNCWDIPEGRKLLAQESAERVEKEPFGAFPFWWTTETHLTKYRSNEARK
jgi:hypothetical protein